MISWLSFAFVICMLSINPVIGMDSTMSSLDTLGCYYWKEDEQRRKMMQEALKHNNEIRNALSHIIESNGKLDLPVNIQGAGIPIHEIIRILSVRHYSNHKYNHVDLVQLQGLLNLKKLKDGPLLAQEGADALNILINSDYRSSQIKAIYLMLQHGCIDPATNPFMESAIRTERARLFKPLELVRIKPGNNISRLPKEIFNCVVQYSAEVAVQDVRVPQCDFLLSCIKKILSSHTLDPHCAAVMGLLITCGSRVDVVIEDPKLNEVDNIGHCDIDLRNMKKCTIMEIVTASLKWEGLKKVIQEASDKRKALMVRGWDGKLPVPEQYVKEVFGKYCEIE